MISPLLSRLLNIARQAGEVVLQSYRGTFDVSFKGPNDPVTSADRAANDLICRALKEAFPGWTVVAEESDSGDFKGYREADFVFFVDPIDGTQEFLDHTDEFVVMIGLLTQQRAVAGVIHSPVTGQFWVGELGAGAYRITSDSAMTAIRPSRVEELSNSRILVSRSHRDDHFFDGPFAALGAGTLQAMGSAGLKGVTVAEGQADAYVAPRRAGKRWDACALDAIVSAAGGQVSDVTGQPIDYRGATLENDRGLVVSNGALHPSILNRLALFFDHGLGPRVRSIE